MKKSTILLSACLAAILTGPILEPSAAELGVSLYEESTETLTAESGADLLLAAAQEETADLPSMEESSAVTLLAWTDGESTGESSDFASLALVQLAEAAEDEEAYAPVYNYADTSASMTGKLYDGCVAEVVQELEGWCYIRSGSVAGFVSSDCLRIGDEAAIEAAKLTVAKVNADNLRIRSEASSDGAVLGEAVNGREYTVFDTSEEGWVGILWGTAEGYVSADYVELSETYPYGETLEEEEARLALADLGESVAAYGLQFVGNPYVWGGTSLTNGADCSGFVMSVYANFGYSLPHSSSAMRSCGYGVSLDELQPGDIICYSGHVALYIGNGQIVHASNSREGIIVSEYDYKPIICARRLIETEE